MTLRNVPVPDGLVQAAVLMRDYWPFEQQLARDNPRPKTVFEEILEEFRAYLPKRRRAEPSYRPRVRSRLY